VPRWIKFIVVSPHAPYESAFASST